MHKSYTQAGSICVFLLRWQEDLLVSASEMGWKTSPAFLVSFDGVVQLDFKFVSNRNVFIFQVWKIYGGALKSECTRYYLAILTFLIIGENDLKQKNICF